MRRKLLAYLWDIRKAGEHTLQVTSGVTLELYVADLSLRRIVERNFEIIGESLNQARCHYPEALVTLGEAQKIVDFRNLLAHGYQKISDESVWLIVKEPRLKLLEKVAALKRRSKHEDIAL